MDHKDESQTGDGGGVPPPDSDGSKMIELLQNRVEHLESEMKKLQKTRSSGYFDQIFSNPAPEPDQIKEMASVSDPVQYFIMKQQEAGTYRRTKGKSPTTESHTSDSQNDEGALLQFTEYQKKDGTREKVEITIRSSGLINLIRGLMEDVLAHEGLAVWKRKIVHTTTKNPIMLHCFDILRKAAFEPEETANTRAPEDVLEQLRSFVKDVEIYEDEIFKERSIARTSREISHNLVWTLFKPGTEVVTKLFNSLPQIMVVHRHRPNRLRPENFDVTCWMYDWNGTRLVKQLYEITIFYFKDTKPIKDLECYPLQYHGQTEEDVATLRQDLIKRGRLFKEYCLEASEQDLMRSHGPIFPGRNYRDRRPFSLFPDSMGLNEDDSDQQDLEIDAPDPTAFDIIIDPFLFKQMSSQSSTLGRLNSLSIEPCQCKLCTDSGMRTRWENWFKKRKAAPQSQCDIPETKFEEYFSLLPPRVLGYVFDRKVWGQFPVESLQRFGDEDHESGWDELTLKKESKTTIRKMVTAHLQQDRSLSGPKIIKDPVPGKGEGLVLLLHGVPGVGKTLTAETLATVLKRRLLRIDASDFRYGDTAQVSNTFTSYFRMAHSWGSILLLDEADVFLQNRERDEIKQNALVSVLLRHLEYFQGVLIMTTNRVVSVDPAVQSRIHYALQFSPLKPEEMQRIVENLIKQLDDSNTEPGEEWKIKDWFKEHMEDICQEKFNGRDMRNIFTTAQLLALSGDSGRITLQHIKDVYTSSKRFLKELANWRYKLESDNAAIPH